MKKLGLALALLLPAVIGHDDPAIAQCSGIFPPNTYCGNLTANPALPAPINIPGGGSTAPYIVTGGNTSRSDVDRWVDQAISAPDIGVDCTGVADSTAALQAYIDAKRSSQQGIHVKFPMGCVIQTTQPLIIIDSVGATFESDTFQGSGQKPQWLWRGTNGGDACGQSTYDCQYVFEFWQGEHPTIRNMSFFAGGNPASNDTISGAVAGTNGVVRLTVTDSTRVTEGGQIVVDGVLGTVEANGKHRAHIVDATHIELRDVLFVNAYSSGGTTYDYRKDWCPDGFLLFDGQGNRTDNTGNGSTTGTTVTITGPFFFQPQDVGLPIQAGSFNGNITAYLSPTSVTVSGPTGVQAGINVFVGQHIGTNARIIGNGMGNGGCGNPMFRAVDISPLSGNNHENYVVSDNTIFCGYTIGGMYSRTGVTNGTTTVTAVNTPFASSDVGKRIRLSFWGGEFDTLIAGFTNSGTITVAAAVPFTQSAVSVMVGDSYGMAVRNGASQNAIQQQVSKLQYTFCAFGIYGAGGNMQIIQPTGGFADMGIYIGGFTAQNTTIDFYASEQDYIAIWLDSNGVAPYWVTNGRYSNGLQPGHGHVNMAVPTFFGGNQFNFGLPSTNSVLVNKIPGWGKITDVAVTTPGAGYVNGVYNNVPLHFVNGRPFGSNVLATVTVAGNVVTAVTITGGANLGWSAGDFLTANAADIGGAGSGFIGKVIGARTALGNVNAKITSVRNKYFGGCCGTTPDWLTSGLGLYAFDRNSIYPTMPAAGDFAYGSEPAVSINDDLPSQAAGGAAGVHTFGCWDGPDSTTNTACMGIHAGSGTPNGGIGLLVNTFSKIVSSGPTIGIKSSSLIGNASTNIAFQGKPTPNAVTVAQTMFEAGWNMNFGVVPTLYGYRSRSPGTISGGSVVDMYGYHCDKQGVTNVATGYCFYASDIVDINWFAGGVTTPPTTVGALPPCNAINRGRRMFVTDGNTANAFRGAVTAGGALSQWVICDGAAWLQG